MKNIKIYDKFRKKFQFFHRALRNFETREMHYCKKIVLRWNFRFREIAFFSKIKNSDL